MPQFESIALRKAYVSGEPELVTITPKSGENKDREVDVVKFNIAHSTWQPDPSDSEKLVQSKPTYYEVRVYGDDAEHLSNIIKVGMAVNVEGSVKTDVWNDNNGDVREKHIINADDVALNLSQKRIESIQMAPKADLDHTQKKSLDKPISERPKAGYTSPQAKSGIGLS